MTQLRNSLVPLATVGPERPHRWPLAAAASGLLGLVATLGLLPERPGLLPSWGAVATLLLTAAGWRRWVEPRVRSSTAATLVPLGLVVSAAAVATRPDWVGWAGVSATAAAVSWMALRERSVARWIGVVSLLPALLTTWAAAGGGVTLVADVAAPVWLVVAGLGLAFGRSTITR